MTRNFDPFPVILIADLVHSSFFYLNSLKSPNSLSRRSSSFVITLQRPSSTSTCSIDLIMPSLFRSASAFVRSNFRKLLLVVLLVDAIFIARFAYEFAENQQNRRSANEVKEKHPKSRKEIAGETKKPDVLEAVKDVRRRQRGLTNRLMVQLEENADYDVESADFAARRRNLVLRNAALLPSWQKLNDEPEVFVYKAFYDSRRNLPSVVILALIHKDVNTKGIRPVNCYFPIKSTLSAQKGQQASLIEVPGNRYEKGFHYGAWMFVCSIPYMDGIKEDPQLPETVTLDSGSLMGSVQLPLRVPTRPPTPLEEEAGGDDGEQKTFAVCLSPLDGNTKASEIVQVVEMSKLLGVQNVIVQVRSLSEDLMTAESVDKILQVYDEEGFVEELPWHLPVDEKKVYKAAQAIAYLDCFYTSLYHFSFLLFSSAHELLVPQDFSQFDSLFSELAETAPNKSSGFCFFGAVFADAKYPQVYRRPIGNIVPFADIYSRTAPIREHIRCFVDTQRISHMESDAVEAFPISEEFVRPQRVSPEIALNHIYRECDSSSFGEICETRFLVDRSILRYRSEFVLSYRKAINSMQVMLQRHGA